ncbi:unnamed protein product [Lota lota]
MCLQERFIDKPILVFSHQSTAPLPRSVTWSRASPRPELLDWDRISIANGTREGESCKGNRSRAMVVLHQNQEG